MNQPIDPVRVQRAKVADLVSKGIRLGSALYVFASVVFFASFMTGFKQPAVIVIIVTMVLGSMLLAPALVFKYGVKAADRADRDDSW